MIKINNITKGRFGNRVLQYNSGYQLAKMLDTSLVCCEWEGCEIFDDISTQHSTTGRDEKILAWDNIPPYEGSTWEGIKEMHDEFDLVIDDPAYLLHNVFYQLTRIAPRNFLKLSGKLNPNLPNDVLNVGLHFRGDDILGADGNAGREIHPTDYYTSALEVIEREFPDIDKKYYMCSDDTNFSSFIETIDYANKLGLDFCLGPATGNIKEHIGDFALLTECDVLISSSSTYVVAAALVGKEKKVVHYKEWLLKNLRNEPWYNRGRRSEGHIRRWQLSFDNFWVSVANGGNEFYRAWRIL